MGARQRPKYQTQTSIMYVLEEPRGQDRGFEDYNTGLIQYLSVLQSSRLLSWSRGVEVPYPSPSTPSASRPVRIPLAKILDPPLIIFH
jgi:hypothetical protein